MSMEVVRPAPARAADLLNLALDNFGQVRRYWDRSHYSTFEEQLAQVAVSATVYIGNLSFYTSEQHVYEMARQSGPIKKVIMGLHRETKTPCGFAFVEYFTREACENAELLLNGKKLENCTIKFEIDPGFKEGRQFGRGRAGGQVRDDFREDNNPERGGVGALVRAGLLQGQLNNAPTQPPMHSGGSYSRYSSDGGYRGESGYGGPPPLTAYSRSGPVRDGPSSYSEDSLSKHGRYDDSRGGNSRGGRRYRSPPPNQRRRNYSPRDEERPYGNQPASLASASGAEYTGGRMVDEFGRDIDPNRRD